MQWWNWPRSQKKQWPHAVTNDPVTRSPGATRETPSPTVTTSPVNSWPSVKPGSTGWRPWRMCRSDPHTPAAVTRTSASSGSDGSGSGFSSTRTSPGAWKVTACTS